MNRIEVNNSEVQQRNILVNSLAINIKRLITTAALLLIFARQGFSAPSPKGVVASQLPPVVAQTVQQTVGAGPLEDAERKVENGEVVYEITVRRAGVERSLTVTAAGRLSSKRMFLNELPPTVIRSIQAQAAKNGLGEIDWVDDDGDISYEIEIVRNGKKYNLTLGVDGIVRSIEMDLVDTPEAVRNAVAAQIDSGKLTSIARNYEDDEESYYAEGTKAGKKRSINFSPDGKIINETIDLASAPPAVQKAIKEQAVGARVTEIERMVEEGDVMFDVKVVLAGKKHGFTIGEDGTLLAIQVTVADLPPPVRKELTARVGSGHIFRLEKAIDGSDITYEIEAKVKGKMISLTLNPDGTEAQ